MKKITLLLACAALIVGSTQVRAEHDYGVQKDDQQSQSVGGTSSGQQGEDQSVGGSMSGSTSTHSSSLQQSVHKVSDYLNKNVQNTQGETLGKIEDFVIDAQTGDIKYAVLSADQSLQLGDKRVAIPMDSLRMDKQRNAIHLNVQKQQLTKAPSFSKENPPQQADFTWIRSTESLGGSEAGQESGESDSLRIESQSQERESSSSQSRSESERSLQQSQ